MEKTNLKLGNLLSYIKYPSLTEKSMNLYANRQYTFIVDRSLTKPEIKFILENMFEVKIISVNTSILPLKTRRVGKFTGKTSQYKKAFVTLKEGDVITDLLK
jgi:large subunit ribosomal protein L23